MSASLPRLIPRGLIFPQPVISEGMEMYSFMIRGSRDKLQAMCDTYLNAPSNGAVQYVPVSNVIIVTITDTKKVRSGDPTYGRLGYISERETAFWIHVENSKDPGKLLSFFMPYLFVNESTAICAGREIFGFAKEYGVCRMPADPGSAGNLGVDVWAIDKFAPDAFPQQRNLISFVPSQPDFLKQIADTIVNGVDALGNFIRNLGTPGGADADLAALMTALKTIAQMDQPQFQMIFLKQFPDITNGTLACYQAVLAAPVVATKVSAFNILPAYEFTVHQYDSHPVIDALGLQLQNGTSTTVFATYFCGDTTIGNGSVLWAAGPETSKAQTQT